MNMRVIIEVSPARLALHLASTGQILAEQEMPSGDWQEDFAGSLSAHTPWLAQQVAGHKLAGAGAAVWYFRDATPVIVSSCPKVVSGESAAQLALSEASTLPAFDTATCVLKLGIDRSGQVDQQHHSLAFAESDSILLALQDFAEAASLRFAGAVPHSATAIATAFGHAAAAAIASPIVSLYLGVQCSAIVASDAGRIRFARTLPIGIAPLAQIIERELARVISEQPNAGQTIAELPSGPVAKLMLTGIPRRGVPCGNLPGISLDAIVPFVQPVLQRLAVEIKQSIRFGFSEQTRSAVRLVICGPGAAVGGLGEIVATLSGSGSHEIASPASSPVPQALRDQMLVATTVASTRRGYQLRRSMIVGSLLAVCAIAVDAGLARLAISQLQREIAVLSTSAGGASSTLALADNAASAEGTIAAVGARVRAWAHPAIRPELLSREIAAAVAGDALLQEVDFRTDKSSGIVRLRGVSTSGDSRTVRDIVSRLANSPMFTDAKLDALRKGGRTAAGKEGEIFELTLRIAAMPAAAAFVDAAGQPGQASRASQLARPAPALVVSVPTNASEPTTLEASK